MSTFVELIEDATALANAQRDLPNQTARREFSIAITALEDAQMRYTRGLAILQDKFSPADLEK